MTIGDLASWIMALATAGSLIYISRQVNVARRQAKGQFLLALDAQFEKFNAVTARLVNGQSYTPTGDDWILIFGLMSVFERIHIMVEDNILDIGLVDRLHGFRLLAIIANDTIFQRLLATGSEWQDLIDLCYAIADKRRKHQVSVNDKAFIERVYQLNKEAYGLKNPFQTQ